MGTQLRRDATTNIHFWPCDMTVQINTSGHNDQTGRINTTKSGGIIRTAHYSPRFNPNVTWAAINSVSGIMNNSANKNERIMNY
jgi:hypothetical protein